MVLLLSNRKNHAKPLMFGPDFRFSSGFGFFGCQKGRKFVKNFTKNLILVVLSRIIHHILWKGEEPGMNSLAVLGILACGLTALLLYGYCLLAEHRDAGQLQRLRESLLYRQLKAQMQAIAHHDIDEVRIECSGITVTSVSPAHTLLSFSFKQNGNSLRNDSFTGMYAELLARDFPLLAQKTAYKLERYKVYRLNGKPERACAFIMRRGYKDYLLAERSPAQLRIY